MRNKIILIIMCVVLIGLVGLTNARLIENVAEVQRDTGELKERTDALKHNIDMLEKKLDEMEIVEITDKMMWAWENKDELEVKP